MSRRATHDAIYEAVTLEGGLLTPEALSAIAAMTASGQDPHGYVQRGLLVRDEIARSWRLAEIGWRDFVAARREGGDAQAATRAWTKRLLTYVLDVQDVADGSGHRVGDKAWPMTLLLGGGAVPLLVAPHTQPLDQPVKDPVTERRLSAHGQVQACLNDDAGMLWGVAMNGLKWRILRDHAALTRPAWIEFDLERLFSEARFSDFALFWLMNHASRWGQPTNPGGALERWREESQAEGIQVRDKLRLGVAEALERLGTGFLAHPDNQVLRERLASGEMSAMDLYQELLRLVYRLIFLWTVEARDLLHPPGTPEEVRTLYARGYGASRLVDRALARGAQDMHGDLWAVLAVALGELERGQPLLGLPALGGLFRADQCPGLAGASLRNRDLLAAVRGLAWFPQDGVLHRVNWRALGTEELGSVYEGLLALVPEIRDHGRAFGFMGSGDVRGHAQKLTGSYYTPDVLVQQVLTEALDPVVAQRMARHPGDPDTAILGMRVIDPACGSGHFLLGAARRLAARLHQERHPESGPSGPEARQALRDVITHCIHGVDRNPMAIELARVALWLEGAMPDRPLTFLDHHLVVGDALLGVLNSKDVTEPRADGEVGIPDDAWKVLTGDDKTVAANLKKRNKVGRQELVGWRKGQASLKVHGGEDRPERLRALAQMPDDTPEAARAKEEAWRALQVADASPEALAMDLLVGAFLLPKRPVLRGLAANGQAIPDALGLHLPTTVDMVSVLRGEARPGDTREVARAAAVAACREALVLHWPLAFGHVLADGGFDVVVGNPPWERLKLQEEEYFASRHAGIAQAANKAARQRMIDALESADPGRPDRLLFESFQKAKREAEAASLWAHQAIRYPLTGTGDVNTYALFAETALALQHPRGRTGLIVPSGIASDDSTSAFFAHLSAGRLVRLVDYENREKLFPAVDSRVKFCVLAIGQAPAATFSFFLTHPGQATDPRRQFRLTPEEFARINPNTRTCPVFRSAKDAELTKKIYAKVPVLWDETREDGNPWGVKFARLFDMSNDSHLFRDARQRHTLKDPVPLYEAKYVHHYDHRWATCDAEGNTRDLSEAEKQDPHATVTPRYWVERQEVEDRLAAKGWGRGWLMGWRDITNATNERTVIAGVVPRVGVGNTSALWFPSREVPIQAVTQMAANLSSLVVDYVARMKVGGTHLNYFLFKQLPVLAPGHLDSGLGNLLPLILELTYTAWDLKPFYDDLVAEDPAYDPRTGQDRGQPFTWNPERRAVLRAELDAWYAHAYGLSRDDLRYILDPAAVMGADYPTETFRGLKRNELARYGEYRTERLVLEAWDRMFGRWQEAMVPTGSPGGVQA